MAWIHSHVNGAKCFMSSVDCHTQYNQQSQEKNILSLIIQIESDIKDFQFFKLTKKGEESIRNCQLHGFHDSCSQVDLYETESNITFCYETDICATYLSGMYSTKTKANPNIKCPSCQVEFNIRNIKRHIKVNHRHSILILYTSLK